MGLGITGLKNGGAGSDAASVDEGRRANSEATYPQGSEHRETHLRVDARTHIVTLVALLRKPPSRHL